MDNEMFERATEIAKKEQERLNSLKVVEKNQEAVTPKPIEDSNIYHKVKDEILDKISNTPEFQDSAQKLYMKKTEEDMKEEALAIKNQELRNELENYRLNKEKEIADTTAKYEKRLIKERVKAKIQQQKIDIAIRRYGYLTPLYDENGVAKKDEDGNIIVDMQKFTPNKMSNRFKELEFNYQNMSATARKIIWTTLKTAVFSGLIALGGWVLFKFIVPLLQSLPTV